MSRTWGPDHPQSFICVLAYMECEGYLDFPPQTVTPLSPAGAAGVRDDMSVGPRARYAMDTCVRLAIVS